MYTFERRQAARWRGPGALALAIILAFTAPANAADATLEIDRSEPLTHSSFQLGATHTHGGLDRSGGADPRGIERAAALLEGALSFQNTHIIGWGPGDIQPDPDTHDWDTLDARIAFMREIDLEPVITLCTAPGWMKRTGRTWAMEDRPEREHFDDFADLAVEVARRYPEVRYYQVWNELKGFWNREINNWDYELFTEFYNKVYDALKAHVPDLKVGGPYIVLEGTGGAEHFDTEGHATFLPISGRDRRFLEYWLEHKHGADFFTVDRHIDSQHDPNTYDADQRLALTPVFGHVHEQIRELTDLPIWWSEFYGPSGDASEAQIAATLASMYYHMIHGGASVALIWEAHGARGTATGLLSRIGRGGDGEPLEHYHVARALHDHFPPGTPIYRAASSDPMLEALASPTHLLLINKNGHALTVQLDDPALAGPDAVTLDAYQVKLVALED